MKIAPAIGALVTLEEQVSTHAASLKPEDRMRVYEWRPAGIPELPAIWNWIDSGTYELADTANADDLLIVAATIGVKPSDVAESAGRLVRLMDVFREVVDPQLNSPKPLEGTVRYAKRVITRSLIEDFNDVPVMGLSMLIRLQLRAHVA